MATPVAIELDKNNIEQYLRQHTDILTGEPVEVRELFGEDSEPEDEGFVNFIYRVLQGGKSYIIKQSRQYLRREGVVDSLPAERNYFEYLSFMLRDGIVKDTVPQMYHVDMLNNIFVMEDLAGKDMRLMRFQLNEGREFVNFSKQIAIFMACNHFYTSELFLDKGLFREMQLEFANLSMRAIMEDQVLTKHFHSDGIMHRIGARIWDDPELRLELMKTRDVFIRKGECLIHGDLHTSNVFVNEEGMRVIDMEYSFVAPFSYDLGYLLANFVSQYAAFMFNSAYDRQKRESFQQYLLDTIQQVFESYFQYFRELFLTRAKPIYRETPGYLENYLFPDILHEALGFMAAANLFRITNMAPFPDFDALDDPKDKILAQGFSVSIDEFLLRNRAQLTTPKAVVDGILATRKAYLRTVNGH